MIDFDIARALVQGGGYFLGRAFGGNRMALDEISKRTSEICGAHVMRSIKPYFDETHLTRIRNTRHYTVKEIIDEHLNRKSIEFRSVRIHWIEDAWIIDGSVFVHGSQRIDLRSALEKRSLLHHHSLTPKPPFTELSEGVLVAACAGSTWFGHWLEDEVPLLMLGCAHGRPIAHLRDEFSHEAAYRDALSLSAPARLSVARIGMLGIVDEFAQNPNKTYRYELMRKRLAKQPKGKDRIFLYRGASGTPRNLVNERELAARLEREGFVTVDVGASTFDELLRQCLGASIVVSVEGSQLAHALFMVKDYGTMLILCPPNQVHTTVAEIGVFCRLTSGIFVCEEAVAAEAAGFFANPDEVLQFLDRLLLHSENARSTLGAYVDEVVALAGHGDEVTVLRGEARCA